MHGSDLIIGSTAFNIANSASYYVRSPLARKFGVFGLRECLEELPGYICTLGSELYNCGLQNVPDAMSSLQQRSGTCKLHALRYAVKISQP